MEEINNIGIIELSSIAVGYQVEDALLKTAPVQILIARSVCSGKFLIVISGSVSAVKASVESGVKASGGSLIEYKIISNLHQSVFPALGLSVQLESTLPGALGVIETFSASSAIEAADAAVKNADIKLIRINLAMAMGGKGLVLFSGGLGETRAAMDSALVVLAECGMLAGTAVISAPSVDLLKEYI